MSAPAPMKEQMFNPHWCSGNNAKKMHSDQKSPRKGAEEPGWAEVKKNGVAKALAYTPPVLRVNNCGTYIEFHAYDPAVGKMRRKRIKLNHIDGKMKRKSHAAETIKRLSDQLSDGWNPWTDCDPDNIVPFSEALDKYEELITKQMTSGIFRKQTYDDYKSKIKILRHYVGEVQKPKDRIRYVFQFRKKFCIQFLDYIYIERNNGAQTYNNYLNFLRVLAGWMVERGYIHEKATDGISPISKRLFTKERTCIPIDKIREIGEWTKANDPHFHFACQLLYYCFIRPVEMTRLKVSDFNLKECTVTIPASASKNKRTQSVTLPKKVLYEGIGLGVFSAPMSYHVFSDRLRPGQEQIDTKIFRDHWEKVSKALKLKKEWKFYSLKDTGITEMLRKKTTAPVHVKEQARHSSLAITEIYIGENREAVPEIRDLDGAL